MADVIIWKLHNDQSYDEWYDFLNWMDIRNIREVSSWDDRSYSNTMYKSYKIDDQKDLSYILLKWPVIYKGNYIAWKALRDSIENTVFTDDDIKWIERDD